jgi:uncharacterized protein YjbI with pentapeptide repeats
MVENSEEPESRPANQAPPKTKAEENPWYLLATLYGKPGFTDDGLKAKNRVAWNRYFAANLGEETRTKLIEEKRHPAKELTPFSPKELEEVASAFAKRRETSAKKELALPTGDDVIDFSNVKFEQDVFFWGYLFSGPSNFESAAFFKAGFEDATFSDWANFHGATFSDWANFHGAAFFGVAVFSRATFSSTTIFRGVTFSSNTHFDGATLSCNTFFDGAIFCENAVFRKAIFGETTRFVNAEMKGETSFEGAIFNKEPPKFFGAKLHQGTVWRGIKWPPKPKDKKEAGTFLDAYACLKLEMDRLKKHEDELDFFALELQSRRVLFGPWRGLPIALYGLVSDYGRSYARPLYALFAVAAIGTLVLLLSGAQPSALAPWQSLGLSFANTFNVFGFRKDFFDAATIERLPAPLKILAAAQTILGTILLFLFGLGIRNKFRMK